MSLNPLNYGPQLRQPDQRSCGPSCLVVARMRLESAYAAEALPAGSVRRCSPPTAGSSGSARRRGALQLPWPRALGTPPWAVAHEMGRIDRDRVLLAAGSLGPEARLRADPRRAGRGAPGAVFVGNRLLPRHVVLATDAEEAGGVVFYNPANGRLTTVSREAITTGALELGAGTSRGSSVTPRP